MKNNKNKKAIDKISELYGFLQSDLKKSEIKFKILEKTSDWLFEKDNLKLFLI